MAERSVTWTKTAAKQRRSILAYWVDKTNSADYSIKFIRLTRERIQYLVEHPYSGRKADFPRTRVASLGHYSIFYKVLDDKIIITAFWDNRQDPKILYKLLTS
ncbi:MAG: type II toxin-antitoxin system RelE/ParE family toxin [Balneolaceae bacterium]|nr:type II toxin-antitoxin system RelE/ParE family toxin [Balneolaceae bacterium]MDR9407234.1 type II toxin-antitoxin system RelE/ParE family toxin [Balneolaceae bacterium]